MPVTHAKRQIHLPSESSDDPSKENTALRMTTLMEGITLTIAKIENGCPEAD